LLSVAERVARWRARHAVTAVALPRSTLAKIQRAQLATGLTINAVIALAIDELLGRLKAPKS
jgi:hypothetical protein